MLIEKCSDKNYLTEGSDYIVEGTVEKVESKWNKEKDTIFSYIDLKIDKYIKGDALPEDRVKIITRSGCVEGICAVVEEEPEPTFFQKGNKVKVYLERINGEFRLLCKFLGVGEIRTEGQLDAISRIEEATVEGRLNDKEAFMLKARLFFAPDTINSSSEFALKPTEKLSREECLTGIYKELHKVYSQLTVEDKKLLKTWSEDFRVIIDTREQE